MLPSDGCDKLLHMTRGAKVRKCELPALARLVAPNFVHSVLQRDAGHESLPSVVFACDHGATWNSTAWYEALTDVSRELLAPPYCRVYRFVTCS